MRDEEHLNQGTHITEMLRDGFDLVIKHVQERLAEAGFDDVRPAHLTIFQHLRPEGSRIGELAERAGLTNQSVGYLVDYLEQHGYVQRRQDPRNRRATLVCLTEHGWAEMRACGTILDDIGQQLRDAFGSTGLDDFEASLMKLERTLRSLR